MKRFVCRDDGNASVEFVILFPGIMMLFFMGFEAGYYMVRNVALERAVDIAVRDVRLGNGNASANVPDHAALKRRICDVAGVIPDCMKSVKVEIMPVQKKPGGVANALGGTIRCIDKSAPLNIQQQVGSYDIGAANELMLVHACATSEPLFPTTRVGVGMKVDSRGNVAIVSATAFVNEPGQRTMMSQNAGGGGNGGGGNGNGGGINVGGGATGG